MTLLRKVAICYHRGRKHGTNVNRPYGFCDPASVSSRNNLSGIPCPEHHRMVYP